MSAGQASPGLVDLNRGALAPVADEVVLDGRSEGVRVQGRIPIELNGTLVRNGPNPFGGRFQGDGMLAWWPEAAMLHAVTLADGAVVGYRNRWARTRQWAEQFGQPDAGSHPPTNPNVNVIQHAGITLALAEGGPPVAISSELDSSGVPDSHPGLAAGITAHPRVDPETGELIWFKSDWSEPWLRYGVTGSDGAGILCQDIDVPAPAMMHDFGVTRKFSVLLDLNVVYDFDLLNIGVRIPIRWDESRRARLGVVARHGGLVRWYEISPCFIQHVVNAYDDADSRIVMDVIRYPEFLKFDPAAGDFLPNPLGQLWRYVVDLDSGRVTEQALHDLALELPRINEIRTGRPYRYLYAVEQPNDREMRGIVRFDLEQNMLVRHEIEPGDQNSEPVFVAKSGGQTEDEGWVLFCAYRHATDTSDLVILDAQDIAAEPLAKVSLPRRIPAGFHGAWLPGEPG